MEQIVETLGWFIISYVVIRLATAWLKDYLTQTIRAEVDEFVERLETGKLVPVTVEVDQEQYFCYNVLTKDFVCQGYTLLELAERFALRFPGSKLAIHNGDKTAVQTLKEQLEKLYENRSSK